MVAQKLIDIATGWYFYLKGSESTRRLMEKRLAVCDGCAHKAQVSPVGTILLNIANDQNNLFKCDLCSCPLGSLSSIPNAQCKAGKWDNIR